MTQTSCPFPKCGRTYTCKASLERHISYVRVAGGDENHPLNDPLFNTFQRKIVTRPVNLTAAQKNERRLATYRKYNAKRSHSSKPQVSPNSIIEFKSEWIKEACSLKTPHWKLGLGLLNQLLVPTVEWTAVEPHTDISILFETPPTIEHLIEDLHNAEKKRKLKLIDSRSSKPDGISQHSAKNLLECISAIENKTFNAQEVHYSMTDMAASPLGLEGCIPKPVPQHVLSVSTIIPKVPMCKYDPSRPKYTSLLAAGGMYTPIHFDFTFLAQFTLVIAKGCAKKLFLMWPANENNLSFMYRRARGETPVGWEDDFRKLTGLKVAILRHGQYLILPEHTLHCVLTVGTAGVAGFAYARGECLENPEIGVWDVERIESLTEDGLSAEGRKALMVDVRSLLDELEMMRSVCNNLSDKRFETLERRLHKLEQRLKTPCIIPPDKSHGVDLGSRRHISKM